MKYKCVMDYKEEWEVEADNEEEAYEKLAELIDFKGIDLSKECWDTIKYLKIICTH